MKRIKHIFATFVVLMMTLQTYAQKQILNYDYEVKRLGKQVNNKYSNFGPSYYGDKVIYASPVKRNYIIDNIWKPNQQPYLDLYIGKIGKTGELLDIRNFSKKLNTKYHEGDVCFTKNLKRVYFTRNNYYKKKYVADSLGVNRLQLYTALVGSNGEWTDVQPLPFNNRHFSTGHPTLSADEKTLYFVSDRPGGYGKTDIYKVAILGGNKFGEPKNLGDKINTKGKEMFPFVVRNMMYYSTDGLEDVKGGLDIYMTKFKGEDDFTKPLNLLTLNSPADDFGLIVNKDRGDGYFSSNRKGGYGDDDIYYFKEIKIEQPKKCIYNITVLDADTRLPLKNSNVRILSKEGKILSNGVTDEKGGFVYTEACVPGVVYQVEGINKPVYGKGLESTVAYNGDNLEQQVNIELKSLFKVENGKLLVKINPIYFDYNEAYIREDARIELEKVVSVMNKYPEIRIEAGSHTDTRGSKRYNQKLSARRAASTARYIISRGIDPNRIVYRGYGESRPVNWCTDGVKCSSEEHQMNRRTEFVILNPEVLESKNVIVE